MLILTPDRLKRLQAVGFVFNALAPGTKKRQDYFYTPKEQETWQLYYDRLAAFHKLHGK